MFAAVAGVSLSSMAQLTTRESDPTTYKIGTRPQAGDLSLMFSVINFSNFAEDSANAASNIANVNGLKTGDLITVKYYKTDDLVIRAGIKLQREVDEKYSFEGDTSNALFTNDPNSFSLYNSTTEEESNKHVVRDWAIKAGIEKHFSNSNFFDVYAGADLYLGFGKEKYSSTSTIANGSLPVSAVAGFGGNNAGFSTTTSLTSARGYTKVGVLPFIGIQMFVLDLPVSVGIEYGWDALWKFGGLWKNDVEVSQQNAGSTDVNGFTTFAEESVSGTYYSTDRPTDAFTQATGTVGISGSASSSMLNTNQNVKLLLNVYFGRGGSSSSDVVIE
jgi:hypothetical protein